MRGRRKEQEKMRIASEGNVRSVPTRQKFHHWVLSLQVGQLVMAREMESDLQSTLASKLPTQAA